MVFCTLPSVPIRRWLRRFRRNSPKSQTRSLHPKPASSSSSSCSSSSSSCSSASFVAEKPPRTAATTTTQASTAVNTTTSRATTPSQTGLPLPTALVPASFTTFPVRVHADEPFIAQGYDAARQMFRAAGVKDFDKRSHSAGPHGNFFAVSWPGGEGQRVRLMAEIIESLWIYDDVIEAVPHDEAVKEHARLKQTFDGVVDKKSLLASIFKDYGKRLVQQDPQGGLDVIKGLKSYLTEYDRSNVRYETIAEYVEFRGLNVGFGIMEASMQWTCSVPLTAEETAALPSYKAYYASGAAVMALTNDYFSWETEKDEPTDRPRNAVPIIMKQYGMCERDAKVFLKGTIVEAEQETKRLGLELVKEARTLGMGERMERYVEVMGLMLGGNCFWSSDCPRYNPWLYPEEEKEA